MIIKPTPVSKIKLNGPLSLILSCMITRFLTSLKGNLTDFDLPSISKYCAFTRVALKHNKHSKPKTGSSLILWAILNNNLFIIGTIKFTTKSLVIENYCDE